MGERFSGAWGGKLQAALAALEPVTLPELRVGCWVLQRLKRGEELTCCCELYWALWVAEVIYIYMAYECI